MKISRRRAVELLLLAPLAASAQEEGRRPNKKRPREIADEPGKPEQGRAQNQKKISTFYTDVPQHDLDIILGRPTRNTITLSILAYADVEGYIAIDGHKSAPVAPQSFKAGIPTEIEVADLKPNCAYTYRFMWRSAGKQDYSVYGPFQFHTPRARGERFTFTIQADSHLDHPDSPRLYTNSLNAVSAEKPDFHIDLGDTFMTDKRGPQFKDAFNQYLAQRYYLGLVGCAAPVFLILGNHDGETGSRFNGMTDSMPAWSNTMRKRYFPNPLPNTFYTGNDQPLSSLGSLQDYYAWEWGNALFVVLDPYWFTTSHSKEAGVFWERTLGETQYRWLSTVLAQSDAPFKFVFIHNLVGGNDESMRGGAEAARLYEWGGLNADGTSGFEQHRPGWQAPIHSLLKRHGVNAVFHGHDHFFAYQQHDGIVYQLLPQPATPGNRNVNNMAAEYGYTSGTFLPSPGYLRVDVGEDKAQVVLVSTAAEKKTDAFSYALSPAQVRTGKK